MEANTATEKTQDGMAASSVLVFGTSFSHPYHRQLPNSDPLTDVNVLSSETSRCLPTNEQTKRQLISSYEKDIEMLKQKLKRMEDFLTLIKNTPPPLAAGETVAAPLQSLVSVHAPPGANLDVTSREDLSEALLAVKPPPTYTELVDMSTIIDEGTGQREPNAPDDGPSFAYLRSLCPINDD